MGLSNYTIIKKKVFLLIKVEINQKYVHLISCINADIDIQKLFMLFVNLC